MERSCTVRRGEMKRKITGIIVMVMLCLMAGFSCRAESAVTEAEEFQVLCKAFLNGQDTVFEACSELTGLIRDINNDGRLELIIRGEIDDNRYIYSWQYAVYAYDETQSAIVRLGEMGAKSSDLLYSQKYHMLVTSRSMASTFSYTFYQAAQTGLTEEFSLMWNNSQPDNYVYTISENGALRKLAVTEEWDDALWNSYTGELEHLEFWPKWKFEYWEKYGYPQKLLSEGTSGTDESSDSADKVVDFDFPEQELIPYIRTWHDMDFSWSSEAGTGISACTLSCPDDESFWKFLSYYVDYFSVTGQNGGKAYYSQLELEQIAFTAFSGYDGGLPIIPENYNIEVSGNQYFFPLATPEEYTCELQNITVGEDGNIEAEYSYTWVGYEEAETKPADTFRVSIHLTDDSDKARAMGVLYCITGLTYISGDDSYGESDTALENMDAESVSSGKEDLKAVEQDGYILPQSSERYLDYADVEGLSLQMVNYAKNEIYARAGRKFNSRELQDYFGSKDWYEGIYEPAEFDQDISQHLNEYEIANGEFLSKVEYQMDANGYSLY